MSVKVKDRHISKQHCLYKARDLMGYILVLTRPREFDKDGKQICKPGLLGEGQPLQAFGLDIIKCGKGIHACCYEASKINLKDGVLILPKELVLYYTRYGQLLSFII